MSYQGNNCTKCTEDKMCPYCEIGMLEKNVVSALENYLKVTRNLLCNFEDDANYYHAIFDGSWPSSIEILERTITKIRKKKEDELSRK